MTERTITITGMNCQHCVAAVTRELSRVPGLVVRDVRIGSATIAVDPEQVSDLKIAEAITEAGFAMVR
jgi:copper chaperone CopZ